MLYVEYRKSILSFQESIDFQDRAKILEKSLGELYCFVFQVRFMAALSFGCMIILPTAPY